MTIVVKSTLLLVLFGSVMLFKPMKMLSVQDVYVSNLDNQCLRCLCFAASGCNLTIGCSEGYCGPFRISRIYWADAGKIVLPEDEIQRTGAYEDCAVNYQCAQRIVKNYIAKYGRDCNDDGRTNCNDYLRMNFFGSKQCYVALNQSEAGQRTLERYYSCYP